MKNIIKAAYTRLAISIAFLISIGSLLGFLTKNSVGGWYKTLNISPLSPPNYVFSIVWTILYAMIATAGWMIWEANPDQEIEVLKKLYVAQLIANWSWTPLFFTYHLTGAALVCLSTIIVLVSCLALKGYKKIPSAALMLVPYLLWLLLAAHLNFYVWQHN